MNTLARVAVLAGCALAFAAGAALGDGAVRAPGRVPKPVIEAAKGEKCVAAPEIMRREHMNLLKHHRDQTVHQGVRTRQYSLNGCIECHASSRNNSVVGGNENFCQSCHTYAAVKLDCFECHTGTPASTAQAGKGRR